MQFGLRGASLTSLKVYLPLSLGRLEAGHGLDLFELASYRCVIVAKNGRSVIQMSCGLVVQESIIRLRVQ